MFTRGVEDHREAAAFVPIQFGLITFHYRIFRDYSESLRISPLLAIGPEVQRRPYQSAGIPVLGVNALSRLQRTKACLGVKNYQDI